MTAQEIAETPRQWKVEYLPGQRDEYVDAGQDPNLIADLQPMSGEAVSYMLRQKIDGPSDMDGRSEWLWVRLANGDLMCGFFPHGDSYFAHEVERTI